MRHLLIALLTALAACAPQPAPPRLSALDYELPELRQFLPQAPPDVAVLAPGMSERQAVLARAASLLGTPYVWGGSTNEGLDCSAFISKAWATGRRHSTDTFLSVAAVIAKEQLLPGDILNLETWDHPTRAGHARIFAAWANAARTRMWVFESRYPQGAIYHVVSYDDRYSPLRYEELADDSAGRAALLTPRQN